MAATLGYDGVEVMVWTDAVSQDVGALQGLAEHYGVPVRSVHAPCLLVTQRVWSPDPWERLRRSAELADDAGRADRGGAPAVHLAARLRPRLRRRPARGCAPSTPASRFAVENMYPVRMARARVRAVHPGWDPTEAGYDAYTLDLSHCAASRSDALAMADAMGAGLAHVHLGDGTGEGRDEHLVPGPGQPAVRASCSRRWPGGGSPARSRSRWPPAGAEPRGARGGPAPSRWRSPAPTWPRRHVDASDA